MKMGAKNGLGVLVCILKPESEDRGMNQDGIYYKVAEEYNIFKRKKTEYMRKRNDIQAKIEMIEEILIELDDILSKYGNHIYEHFSEGKPQPEESEVEE